MLKKTPVLPAPKHIAIAPMGVGGVQHLIERAYREGSDLQYIRELFKNALEAGATQIEFGPEWRAVERGGPYRLMVADNEPAWARTSS